MLPHTHFLFAILLALIGYNYNYFSLTEVFLIGILAVILDIDHLISFYKNHKMWSIKKCWNSALTTHEHLRTFIHHQKGILLVSIILVLLTLLNLKLSIMLAIAYFSHIFLDKIQLFKEKIKTHKFRQLFGFQISISYSEIVLDIILILIIFSINKNI